MADAVGKREAHKQATRQALQEAADRLFAEHGFAETTVRDIAAAAGVTERTFFRYFTGKEELVVEDMTTWLPVLTERIRQRPAEEPALTAIENAAFSVMAEMATSPLLSPALLFHDGPPGPKLSRLAPGLALRLEQAIAEAVVPRIADSPDRTYRAAVTARAAVSALRSAMLHEWRERTANGESPEAAVLIRQAFATLRTLR